MKNRTLLVATIVAAAAAAPAQILPVPLNYNFNGILHAGEAGLPDSLPGFRSISAVGTRG